MDLIFASDALSLQARVGALIIAGWTGRDQSAVEHHIRELEALGVARPREVPMFYRVSASLLTHEPIIQVMGEAASGEVEFVLLSLPEGLYVGVGSDHTDRKLEAYGVTAAKQVCPKPIGRSLWRFEEVESHWDQLLMRSFVTRGGTRMMYQEGAITSLAAPRELMRRLPDTAGVLPVGSAMFCGTLPVRGELAGGEVFEIELIDPVLDRSLRHRYEVRNLPVVD